MHLYSKYLVKFAKPKYAKNEKTKQNSIYIFNYSQKNQFPSIMHQSKGQFKNPQDIFKNYFFHLFEMLFFYLLCIF